MCALNVMVFKEMVYAGMLNRPAVKSRLKLVLAIALFTATYGANAASEKGVKTQLLSEVALYPERSAPASVISLNQTKVSAQINAVVEEIPVRVGDVVPKGAVLARLDCSDYLLATRAASARLDELNARIQLAKKRVIRAKTLRQNNSVSEQSLDEREADLAVLEANHLAARAELGVAELNESRCMVRSPFQALVKERLSATGDYAAIGQSLVEILDLDNIEVSAQVYTQDARHVGYADKLYFEQDGQRYPLSIRSVLPAINSQTRNQEVRLVFSDKAALPGAAGKLVWRDVRPHVPAHLLVKRDGQLGLFIVNEGQARFIAMPAAQAGRASPVNLPDLTPLVVEGHLGLHDAESVENTGGS